MIKEAIIKLSKRQDLTYKEAEQVMNEIMENTASDVQKAAYLTALSMKGETIDEITASAAAMRAHGEKLLHNMDVLEIVGTGGDGSNSFNISTTSALVIASGGVPVAKHGNRAASSKSGAADVLEALGVKIDISPEQSKQLLTDINICFLFAQKYHFAARDYFFVGENVRSEALCGALSLFDAVIRNGKAARARRGDCRRKSAAHVAAAYKTEAVFFFCHNIHCLSERSSADLTVSFYYILV